MNARCWFTSSAATLVAAGLIFAAAMSESSSAAPAKPGLRPKPAIGPKRGFKPGPKLRPKPAVKPGRKPLGKKPPLVRLLKAKARVVPRPGFRAVVPSVYGPRVVIRSGGGVVVRQTPPSVVIETEDDLAVVPSPESAMTEAYRVVAVGEDYTVTLLIDGQNTPVRLLGVDPPLVAESEGQTGELPEEARQFTRNLLVGEFVYLGYDPDLAKEDADGNLVAYLYRAPDKLLVNLELIRQGYGLAAGEYGYQFQEAFISYQQKAQADRKGIWQLVTEQAG